MRAHACVCVCVSLNAINSERVMLRPCQTVSARGWYEQKKHVTVEDQKSKAKFPRDNLKCTPEVNWPEATGGASDAGEQEGQTVIPTTHRMPEHPAKRHSCKTDQESCWTG